MQIKRLLSLGRITDSTEVQIFEGQPTNLKQFLQRFRNINFRFSGWAKFAKVEPDTAIRKSNCSPCGCDVVFIDDSVYITCPIPGEIIRR